jgi:acyl carrier protein
MNNNVESRVKEFLLTDVLFAETEFPVADDASLLGAGIVDSLGVQEIIEFVSREYGLEVPIGDITPDNFDSVCRIGAYVRRRLGECQPPSQEIGATKC